MKIKLFILTITLISLYSCKSAQQYQTKPAEWFNISVAEDVEIYIDTANIHRDNMSVFAAEKRVFTTTQSKAGYVKKIRDAYARLGKANKADKWNDFSYCIYECLYECTNQRFRILRVRDYDSKGELIAETSSTSNKNIRWLYIEPETVGDYTFFYVCDFDHQ
jgi:hypothetical protein